jgi:hypothetical protein
LSQKVSLLSSHLYCKPILDAYAVIAEDKNNNLMSSEGMEATEEEMQDSFAGGEAIVDDADGANMNFT